MIESKKRKHNAERTKVEADRESVLEDDDNHVRRNRSPVLPRSGLRGRLLPSGDGVVPLGVKTMSRAKISCQELPFVVGDVVRKRDSTVNYVVTGVSPVRLQKVQDNIAYGYFVEPSEWLHDDGPIYELPDGSGDVFSLEEAVARAKDMLRTSETEEVAISRVRATVSRSVNYDLKG